MPIDARTSSSQPYCKRSEVWRRAVGVWLGDGRGFAERWICLVCNRRAAPVDLLGQPSILIVRPMS
jgi:hypothetical protein